MKVSLEVARGPHQGKQVPVNLTQFIIGRDPQCHLRPASPMISRRHCALLVRDGRLFVRDFGSTNGTHVNDERVEGERELHDGDRFRVEPLHFIVRITAGVPVDKPTPLPPSRRAEPADDEAVAAMLLNLPEEGGPPPAGMDADPSEIAAGTTVFEMPARDLQAPKAPEKKPAEKNYGGNTSDAAKAILEKYNRRRNR